MKTKFRVVASLLLVLVLLLVSGCGCRPKSDSSYRMKLEVWGFLDDGDALREIFSNYTDLNKHIADIKYKKISTDTYKKEVIEALASGQGPDIFLIHNTWLSNFSDKTVPAPETIFNEQKLRTDFVDVVANDFLKEGKVYAVPLSVDSLGLYYNKDLFNQAGITTPPKTWAEFLEDAGKITQLDNSTILNQVRVSGAAIGTSSNIYRSSDVLSMIMMQNGATMADAKGNPIFDKFVSVNGNLTSPGEEALRFYTDFANISSPYYCWNKEMHYSIDAFSEQSAAMMFNYSWHVDTVLQKNPKLNFAVAPVPQFAGKAPANYANYWGYTVASNKISKEATDSSIDIPNEIRIAESWKLIAYLTAKIDPSLVATQAGSNSLGVGKKYDSNFDPAVFYAKKTGRPGARRDVVETQKTDPKIGAFAYGNLIAKSWYQKDPEATEVIFNEMIDQVNRGANSVEKSLKAAVERIRQQGER